jgi:acetyltransferase-like isoleucine patch superfamily enzyme
MRKLISKWVKHFASGPAYRELTRIGIDPHTLQLCNRFLLKGDGQHRLTPGQLKVGANVALRGRIVIGPNGKCELGDWVTLGPNTQISVMNSVVIGKQVVIAEGVFISDNDNHPTSPRYRNQMTQTSLGTELWKMAGEVARAPVVIGTGAWLGRFSTVLKGVTIGEWSIVGAGAVVTKSIPPFSIAAGNPARVVKQLDNDLDSDGHS